MAFQIASSIAFKDGMRKARPVLLEPIMRIDIVTPKDYMGDVIGDLNRRRGRIESVDDKGAIQYIHGHVPLSEMFGYATTVRSLSQGRASYSWSPATTKRFRKILLRNWSPLRPPRRKKWPIAAQIHKESESNSKRMITACSMTRWQKSWIRCNVPAANLAGPVSLANFYKKIYSAALSPYR